MNRESVYSKKQILQMMSKVVDDLHKQKKEFVEVDRQIKFRSWHHEYKRMVYPSALTYCHDKTMRPIINFLNTIEVQDLPLMQYTGLKDKNGKEIYEGDIMQDRLGAKCQVVYVPEFGAYKQLSKVGYTHLNQADIISSDDTVIGNIHENPDLL